MAQPGPKSPSDRRRHRRFRIGVLTEIEALDKGVIPGITFNVSESGAMVHTLAMLEINEEVNICFLLEKGHHRTVTGRVVHVEEMHQHAFWCQKVGIAFSEGVPRFLKDEFQSMINRERASR